MLVAGVAGCVASPAPSTPRYDGPPGAYPSGAAGEGPMASDDPVAEGPGTGWTGDGPGLDDPDGATHPGAVGEVDGPDADGPRGDPGAAEGAGGELDAAEQGSLDRGAPVAEPAAARRPAGMTDFEVGVAAAASRLRRDPRWLVGALGRYRDYYRGRRMHLPGMDAAIVTVEGVAAVDEAIAAARRSKPRPALRLSAGLSRAARAHARELGRDGSLEHTGRDGSQPHDRMGRHGKVIGLSGENIGTGWGDAEVMVIGLYVDDGVRGRGHRVNLVEPAYRAIGVGCAPHRMYGTVCVLDFAGELRE